MRISELFENDADHFAELKKTGFFGAKGGGCIFFAKDTKRFLLSHRSNAVLEPGTWGVLGGAIDSDENPAEAALREAEEESGFAGKPMMIPLYVYEAKKNRKTVFQYYNFLAVIPTEFKPQLNWESQGFQWCEFGHWPSPLHFGVKKLLSDSKSFEIMKNITKQS